MDAPITLQPLGFAPLQGKRLRLERRAPQHADFIWKCRQDCQFWELYRMTDDPSETVEQIYDKLVEENKLLPHQLRWLEWVIFRIDGNKPIGLAAVADYQPQHQRGEFLIGIVDPNEQKAGIGLETSLLVLDFAFNYLKLHKFMSFVYGYNQSSQQNTLQLGFVQEGLFREHMFIPNKGYIDLYQNGLLESDFRNNSRLAKLSQRLLGCDITQHPPEPQLLSQEELQAFENQLKAFVKSSMNI
jgi:RimJ/RimL family protein N-acetyltransferase